MSAKASPAHCGARKKVLIVDDHPLVRQGLAQLINQEQDLVVSGEAASAAEALRAMAQLEPDVAIVDITLKESDGLDLVKDIKLRHPKVPVLVLSMHDEAIYAERVLRAGAMGYIMKDEAAEKVVSALRRVLAGSIFVSEAVSARLLQKLASSDTAQSSPLDSLSDRELQVFRLIGEGVGTREIAKKLNLSVKTVETYRENIKHKLRLRSASDLLRHAINWTRGTQDGKVNAT